MNIIIDDYIFKDRKFKDSLKNAVRKCSLCKTSEDAYTYFQMFQEGELGDMRNNIKDYVYCLLNFELTREQYEKIFNWIKTNPDLYRYNEIITEANIGKLVRAFAMQNYMDILTETHNILIVLNERISNPYKLVDFKKVAEVIENKSVLLDVLSIVDDDTLNLYADNLYSNYEDLEIKQQHLLTSLSDSLKGHIKSRIIEYVNNWNKVKGIVNKMNNLNKKDKELLKSVIDDSDALNSEQKKLIYSKIDV